MVLKAGEPKRTLTTMRKPQRVDMSRIEAALAPIEETIQSLWLNLMGKDSGVRSSRILMTSARRGDGTTTIAACAALGLARHLAQPVLFLEGNIANPGIAKLLNLSPTPGFAELLRGEVSPQLALRPTLVPGLKILPGGIGPKHGGLSGTRVQQVVSQLAREFRYVIVDSGPLLKYSDGRVLLHFVDSAILVIRARKTPRQEIKKTAQIIENSGTELIGTVLNRYRREAPSWLIED